MTERRPLLLVVDDEESMRWFLEKTLRREGYDVLSARDGPEAIALAQANTVDLVLADVRMPGMDGVALMRALRPTHPNVPVLLMTAYGTVEDALAAMKQGATDYVMKPFRVDAIRATVARALAGGEPQAPTVRRLAAQEDAPAPAPAAAAPSAALHAPPGAGIVAFLRARAAERALPLPAELASGDLGLHDVTRLAETVYLDELLRLTDGNVSRAADSAGITRPNLHRKITDLGLDADAYRGR
jgi:DNA-binding NtrC family response regulator